MRCTHYIYAQLTNFLCIAHHAMLNVDSLLIRNLNIPKAVYGSRALLPTLFRIPPWSEINFYAENDFKSITISRFMHSRFHDAFERYETIFDSVELENTACKHLIISQVSTVLKRK